MNFPVSFIRRNACKIFAVLSMMGLGLNVMAVTDAEMDEAKAIAAKFYVRYINNGAGYLDNWLPKSMSDLEKKLSNKTDRDNLKKFNSVANPTDYSSWDKDKLVAYWSDAFFTENGSSLDPKAADNAMCKKQIKQAVGRLAIAVPAAPQAVARNEADPEAEAGAAAPAATDVPDEVADELARVDAEIQEAHDMVAQEEARPAKKENSGTWVYIMVLAILIAVVIFLVVYASRTMKGHPKTPKNDEPEDEPEDSGTIYAAPRENPMEYVIPAEDSERHGSRSSVAEDSRMREKYAEALAAKAEEIRSLNRQLNDMELLAGKLKDENRRLTAEVEQLRKYITTSRPQSSQPSRQSAGHEAGPRPSSKPAAVAQGEPKEVYLGRVNSKGIFVRADRHAVDGQSIYKLITVNGHTGTYTLIHNPLIEEQVLDDPGKWLAGGCFAKDIFDTEGRQGVRTETPGTAVFRDGAWRVDRKAKIHFC